MEELIQILNSLCIDAVELKNDALLDKCLDARWMLKTMLEQTTPESPPQCDGSWISISPVAYSD